MKTPVKAPAEKSWAGKAMDKFSAKDDGMEVVEKKDSQKKAAETVATQKTIPEKVPDAEEMTDDEQNEADYKVISDDEKRKMAVEKHRDAVQKKEVEGIRKPARKAGVHYISEDKAYPANEQIVLARIPTKPLFLAQFRYAAKSVPPNDPAKGDFYANVGGSWSSLVGKVDAWMALPEF